MKCEECHKENKQLYLVRTQDGLKNLCDKCAKEIK
jgi:NAD-dependent SIR2 family protein deacetylase